MKADSTACADLAVRLLVGNAEGLWEPDEPAHEAGASLRDLVDEVTGRSESGRMTLAALQLHPQDEAVQVEARAAIDAALASDPPELTEAIRLARLVPADLLVLVGAQPIPPAVQSRPGFEAFALLLLIVVGALVLFRAFRGLP